MDAHDGVDVRIGEEYLHPSVQSIGFIPIVLKGIPSVV